MARNQRGAVFPSPVVILSVLAVAMAGIAYVATRGGEPTEREVTPVVQEETPSESPSPTYEPTKKAKPEKPPVQRGKVYVEVYNNSGVTGLAGRVAERATGIGWAVVATDNWYGTIPSTTVYYPQKLQRAAKTLALDLGVQRTAPAVDPMRQDRLTLILTEPLG
ncbi:MULTISPECIES: LytR C-terminal domain-containing protein [unclassified Nocardioides]|uniref:LytR C-terminal domain-containing protein n=1 Tax=unclassified Nocardioides TaxID=2615069 RepID=UPI00362370B0